MRLGLKIGLIGAGVAAGAVGATAIAAGAQSTSPTAATSSAAAPSGPSGSSSGPSGSGKPGGGHGGASPVRGDEKSVSSSVTATLKAAALKAVPGGTVYRIETDADDGVYEAHMTKADGSEVTVKFDKDLKVTKVEAGIGTGDPAPAGQPGTHR